MAFVYLPDDEPDSFQFDSHTYRLRANGTTKFVPFDASVNVATLEEDGSTQMVRSAKVTPADVAQHAVSKLGKWGITVLSAPAANGKASNASDQELVEKAERQYLVGTKQWATDLILDFVKATKNERDADLDVPDTEAVLHARAWLKKNDKALKAAGLA